VRFWDTSAIVPLLVVEPATAGVRRSLDSDPAIVVWWATRTEALSALARQARDGGLGASPAARARTVLDALSAAWSEIAPSEQLRARAERLLRVHALCAGDAFQLSAALLWSRGQTTGRGFVSLDDRLRDAAGREGFRVLPD
jgi:predicted nucleic acid-binding protein